MNLSANDISNPAYRRSAPQVHYEQNVITDYILDDNQDDHVCKIEYSTYFYDHQLRIVELKVTTKANYKMLERDVLELLSLHEGKTVHLDSTIEVIKP